MEMEANEFATMCDDLKHIAATGAVATPSATASRKKRGKTHCCVMRWSQLKQIKAHLTPPSKQQPVQHVTPHRSITLLRQRATADKP
jgi:hypothetical protein